MKLVYKDKLQTLRDYLEENKAFISRHIDMSDYFNTDEEDYRLYTVEVPQEPLDFYEFDCYTSCCAIGWAAVSGLFDNDHETCNSFSLQFFPDLVKRHEPNKFPCNNLNGFQYRIWKFLFGVDNPNNVDLLLDRLDWIIKYESTDNYPNP